MNRIPVGSSSVAEIGYDSTDQVLEVLFLNGGVYQYHGVPLSTYAELIAAESVGAYFNRRIKNVFRVTKLKA